MTGRAYGLLTAEAVWGYDTCIEDEDVQLMLTRETFSTPAVDNGALSQALTKVEFSICVL